MFRGCYIFVYIHKSHKELPGTHIHISEYCASKEYVRIITRLLLQRMRGGNANQAQSKVLPFVAELKYMRAKQKSSVSITSLHTCNNEKVPDVTVELKQQACGIQIQIYWKKITVVQYIHDRNVSNYL